MIPETSVWLTQLPGLTQFSSSLPFVLFSLWFYHLCSLLCCLCSVLLKMVLFVHPGKISLNSLRFPSFSFISHSGNKIFTIYFIIQFQKECDCSSFSHVLNCRTIAVSWSKGMWHSAWLGLSHIHFPIIQWVGWGVNCNEYYHQNNLERVKFHIEQLCSAKASYWSKQQ